MGYRHEPRPFVLYDEDAPDLVYACPDCDGDETSCKCGPDGPIAVLRQRVKAVRP